MIVDIARYQAGTITASPKIGPSVLHQFPSSCPKAKITETPMARAANDKPRKIPVKIPKAEIALLSGCRFLLAYQNMMAKMISQPAIPSTISDVATSLP